MAVQMQTRQETPEQWNRALERALNEALDVLTEPVSGRTFVESGTMPGTLYEVTEHGCSCKAGARGVPCKHRACLLAQRGILPLDTEPAPGACMWCRGSGLIDDGWHEYAVPCEACNGTGKRQSKPAPAVLQAAA